MLSILPVPILQDNYVWLLQRDGLAVVVDPGEAEPVAKRLATLDLRLAAILVTHHHGDHIGGVAELAGQWGCPVYGPGSIGVVDHAVADGDRVVLEGIDLRFEVMAVPGHTLDHIAYHGEGALFCGDTLFACGCGRLFEGTPEQMQRSLAKLAALPDETLVCCTHEYTLSNQRFARAVEPDNPALLARSQADEARRQRMEPTLPSHIGLERSTNPFLRGAVPAVQAAARGQGASDDSPVAVFAALRRWKDQFR